MNNLFLERYGKAFSRQNPLKSNFEPQNKKQQLRNDATVPTTK